MALFNSLKRHRSEFTTKFTSSLHRHTVWECRKALRDAARHPQLASLPDDAEPVHTVSDVSFNVQDCLSMLPESQSSILRDYYFSKFTVREIGQVQGCAPSSVVYKRQQAEEAFRRLYGDD